MSRNIEDIEGIGPAYAHKLVAAGVKTVADLLETGSSPQGRRELSEKTGISESLILKWVSLSDLMRVNGIGRQFAELLEAAGVNTVKELSQRNAANLVMLLTDFNSHANLAGRAPATSQVMNWIVQAKNLDPKVTY